MRTENELRVIDGGTAASGRLTRREMMMRLVAGAGAGAAWPLVAASYPIYGHLTNDAVFDEAERLGAADWKPLFLSAEQDKTLVALAEAIVPGSKTAQVNRFIDLLLSVDSDQHQKSFVESLAAFEGASQKRFGKVFPSLDAGQRNGLLTDAAARPAKKQSSGAAEKEDAGLQEHFENLRGWVSGAYYSSEEGMRELGWTGDYVFASFPGCEHAEGHS
jgi:Gluconate 2-dehydrogenase subunit 3